MKTLLTLIALITTFTSKADFLDASKNYQEGHFKEAFDEFIILAKFGHELSQQNVAVMLYKGEGTEKNLIQAYAWSQILTDEKIASQLTLTIASKLTEEQLMTAKDLTYKYQNHYSHDNSKVLLGPILTEGDTVGEYGNIITASGVHVIGDKFYAPNYPNNMLQKGIQGWVDLNFNIYPDGSVRDIQVTKEVPPKSFAAEAIKSLENYRYKFEKNGETASISEIRNHKIRISFKIEGNPTEFNARQKNYINEIIKKAKSGNVEAQFTYTALYDTYLERKGEIEPEQVNRWLFNAAQSGIHDAQYLLGKNIYYGQDCKVEKQKGIDWIMRSAQVGNPNAEFMAYQMLKNKSVINQSTQPPFYWLEQAAKNGLDVAQLNYAKEIAILEQPTEAQLSLAKTYLESYARKAHKTIQWHQVNAMLRLKTDKSPKKALVSINKAIKKAKKVGWDLSELNAQKQQIIDAKKS